MNLLGDLQKRTRNDICSYSNIVLYGASYLCPGTIKEFGSERISIIFDKDSEKWGREIEGIKIASPDPLILNYKNNSAFVISSEACGMEIAIELVTKWGIEKERLFFYTNRMKEECKYLPDVIESHLTEINMVLDMLSDTESKEYYINYIKACYTRSPFYYNGNIKSVERFIYKNEHEKIGVREGDVILDCGAYIGDTAAIFRNQTKNNCIVYCFEALEGNFNKLNEWINSNKIDNVKAFCVGVGDRKYTDTIYSDEDISCGASVGINISGKPVKISNTIEVDSIDNLMKNTRVDFIKMDIEGFEVAALKGAENTIKNNKPRMNISGYHKLTDLWEIPLCVKSINSGYKVYLMHQPRGEHEPEFVFA